MGLFIDSCVPPITSTRHVSLLGNNRISITILTILRFFCYDSPEDHETHGHQCPSTICCLFQRLFYVMHLGLFLGMLRPTKWRLLSPVVFTPIQPQISIYLCFLTNIITGSWWESGSEAPPLTGFDRILNRWVSCGLDSFKT